MIRSNRVLTVAQAELLARRLEGMAKNVRRLSMEGPARFEKSERGAETLVMITELYSDITIAVSQGSFDG